MLWCHVGDGSVNGGWLGRVCTTLHLHAPYILTAPAHLLFPSLPGPVVGEMPSAARYAAVGMVGRPLTHVVRDVAGLTLTYKIQKSLLQPSSFQQNLSGHITMLFGPVLPPSLSFAGELELIRAILPPSALHVHALLPTSSNELIGPSAPASF